MFILKLIPEKLNALVLIQYHKLTIQRIGQQLQVSLTFIEMVCKLLRNFIQELYLKTHVLLKIKKKKRKMDITFYMDKRWSTHLVYFDLS